MKFNPLSEDNSASEKKLLDPGEYAYKIMDAFDTVSKNGNDMITLRIEAGGVTFNEYLVDLPKLAWKIKSFALSCGAVDEYNSGELIAGDLIGLTGKAMVKVESRDGYDDRNVVEKWLPADRDAVKMVKDALGGTVVADTRNDKEDDDLPF